jgi:LysM repeat protein
MPPMKPRVIGLSMLLFAAVGSRQAVAQTFATNDKASAQLETLTKKIDEQNMKIDALSQQLLKLEQQIASRPPGVMIGESTPAPAAPAAAPATSSATAASSPAAAGGNAHVVAKGETLISIAKTHKVGVDELQKFNHIEDARKLQAGQTIMIPVPGASPAPSAAATATP